MMLLVLYKSKILQGKTLLMLRKRLCLSGQMMPGRSSAAVPLAHVEDGVLVFWGALARSPSRAGPAPSF